MCFIACMTLELARFPCALPVTVTSHATPVSEVVVPRMRVQLTQPR